MAGLIRQVKIGDGVDAPGAAAHARHASAERPRRRTWSKKYVRYGASPRGAQAMILAAKALALLDGRYHVATDDVRRVAQPALNHRIIRNFQGEMERITAEAIIDDVLASTVEP